ncbi:3-hydroxybutyryl-CoA dehydrogenase [Martelella lutilitoris]|uniref:L-gulonate 3-dehydrogenase n=1 Tax=Martelella lutilitoris TaxID=2583532 RepID=A0A5C4JUN1_9HYPH|nr:3-hydroxybutyryl-CoA dehydrogenase [Martelella lutilitoris]TNB48914.1 3-hydroxybutyryl-CoA dehydrogenase [Martelella lutilitoris]
MTQAMTLASIGAGRMGRGIAQCVAYHGHHVRLIDAKTRSGEAFAELEEGAIAEIERDLTLMAELGAFDKTAVPAIMARISVVAHEDAGAALCEASIVFEAVPEVRAAKEQAFALFDRFAGEEAILASTTSTMLSSDLVALTENKARFLNAHWLNPAFLVPLVELSPAGETAPETTQTLKRFLEDIGKVPVVCSASPGYIVPRIQALAMNEAARLVEEGVASAEDVDKAVLYGFGLRFAVLGLLEFVDWGGGDILYYASRYLQGALETDRFEAPEIVQRNMEEGRIGMKTGQGFYDYGEMDVDAYRKDRLKAFIQAVDRAGLRRDPVLAKS